MGKNVSIIESTICQGLGEGIHAGNHISYGTGAFIQVENLVVRNCRVYDFWSGPLYVTNVDGGLVEDNIFYNTADTRFWTGRSGNPQYPPTTVYFASESGRAYGAVPTNGLIGSRDVTFRNNVVVGGLRLLGFGDEPLQTFSNIKIQHNTFFGAQPGTYAAGSGCVYNAMTNLSNLTLENNLFFDASGRVVASAPGWAATIGTSVIRNNLWSHTPPVALQGTGDVVNVAVGLTNSSYAPSGPWPSTSTFDTEAFKLTATSPALGAGATGTGVSTDFFGTARPTTPDIGAHERTP
jgi:hypothetical protein